jgi:hypothetical protein
VLGVAKWAEIILIKKLISRLKSVYIFDPRKGRSNNDCDVLRLVMAVRGGHSDGLAGAV